MNKHWSENMKKFVVIYFAPPGAFDGVKDMSPEEMKEGMKPWVAWMEKCGDGLVDRGAPLGNGQKVTKSGGGPSDKDIAGYSILQADDMEGAKAMLEGHPHLDWAEGCEIEVYEAMPMPH